MIKGFIFDLDGVLVDTAHYHFKAWQTLANQLGAPFTIEQNEQLKGVSRADSLKLILNWGNKTLSENEFEQALIQKNNHYLELISDMNTSELLPGVKEFLLAAQALDIKMALGSASKNAPGIVTKTGLNQFLETIIDGNSVTHSKPDPEVFLKGAEALHLQPQECVVFEDAQKGIDAAINGGFNCVAIDPEKQLQNAHEYLSGFQNIHPNSIINSFS